MLRARTSPQTRRVLGALSMILAVWIATHQLRGAATREVEVRVPLRALSAQGTVRGVTVSFRRGDEVMRSLSQRWSRAPDEMVARVSLPEGPCDAEVTVERDAVLLNRTTAVEVRADEALRLRAPDPL